MSNIRHILDIARRAMAAQQAALSTTGHNIANVNTEGYSRQRVLFETSRPLDLVNFVIGRGVDVNQIERVRSRFLDDQIWSEKQSLSRWQSFEDNLRQIENIFGEPSETGLGDMLNQFWDAWNSLSNNPEGNEARYEVQQQGIMITNKFHDIHRRLTNHKTFIEEEYSRTIADVNNLADQIAGLNRQIAAIADSGQDAGDLRDKRDRLIEQMSNFVNVQVSQQQDGVYTVSLGGKVFIERSDVVHLAQVDISDDGSTSQLVWQDGGTSSNPEGGSLSAMMELHDQVIPDYLENIDTLALALVDKVNSLHTSGYGLDGSTGNDFFKADITGASDISLDTPILENIQKIAASSDGNLGDGSIALSIGQLQDELTMDSEKFTFAGYFRSLVFSIGELSQDAISVREGQELIVSQLENERQSISGVSLDEEMTNMIKFQHAYQAAAKLVSVADELTVTVLDMV